MGMEGKIIEAIATGEVLKVIYLGGSQPGTSRDITPISVKDGILRARCHTSNSVKTFSLEKLRLIDDCVPVSISDYESGFTLSPRYETLIALLTDKKDFLVGLGWHVEADEAWISLHKRKKNGEPLKGAAVSLDYEEYISDSVMDINGDFHDENTRKRNRPWTVRGKEKNTRTVGSLDKAAECFLNWAELLAPATKQ